MLNILIVKLVVFTVGTIANYWISRRALKKPGSHGTYRFLAWESILILIIMNLNVWFYLPWAWNQIISWLLLVVSIYLVYTGVRMLRIIGKPDRDRIDPTLVGIEKTTKLVTDGIYAYIRHPLYSSLLFLAWGVFFKMLSWSGLCISVVATLFLYMTGKIEEKENIEYFGDSYREYMQHTKMFIPYIY